MTKTILVPVEPTPEMLERAAHNLSDEFGVEFVLANKDFALAVYNEFIKAAPKPIPADDREEVARKVIAFLAANKDECGIEGDFDVLRATAVTLQSLGWGKK